MNLYKAGFTGNFKNLMRLLYDLEYTEQLGKVVSASFQKKKDFTSQKEFLTLTFYLQIVRTHIHEN
jgi:hypothetical protein